MAERPDPLDALAAATSELRPTSALSDAVLARLGAEDVEGTLARHAAATEGLAPSPELADRVMARVAAEAVEGGRVRFGAAVVAAALAVAAVAFMIRERTALYVDVAAADWVEVE